jgi:hypothetical protein
MSADGRRRQFKVNQPSRLRGKVHRQKLYCCRRCLKRASDRRLRKISTLNSQPSTD